MLSDTHPASYDVVIVGARVAGAATALQLAQRGLRVLAIERSEYGSDTLSTLALMRAGVLQLHRWGLIDRLLEEQTPAIQATSFHYGDDPEVRVEIKPRDGIDALYAPRRSVLDRLLVDAARAAGARIEHRARVTELLWEGRRVVGVTMADRHGRMMNVRAPLVIGADGSNSTVARAVGAEIQVASHNQSAAVYGIFDGLDTSLAEAYHWFYSQDSAAGIIPTNHGQSLVFASVAGPAFARLRKGLANRLSGAPVRGTGFHEVLQSTHSGLSQAVSGATLTGLLRGFAGRAGHLRESYGPGWALVGDAGYFKDPLTAHGLSDALRDAELLATNYVASGERGLVQYQTIRDELARELFAITDRVASFNWTLESIKQEHLDLSRTMNHEVETMVKLFGNSVSRGLAPTQAA